MKVLNIVLILRLFAKLFTLLQEGTRKHGHPQTKKRVQKKSVHLCGEFQITFRDPNAKEEGGWLGTHQLHNNSHQHREISN
jgi:hypothetical protein